VPRCLDRSRWPRRLSWEPEARPPVRARPSSPSRISRRHLSSTSALRSRRRRRPNRSLARRTGALMSRSHVLCRASSAGKPAELPGHSDAHQAVKPEAARSRKRAGRYPCSAARAARSCAARRAAGTGTSTSRVAADLLELVDREAVEPPALVTLELRQVRRRWRMPAAVTDGLLAAPKPPSRHLGAQVEPGPALRTDERAPRLNDAHRNSLPVIGQLLEHHRRLLEASAVNAGIADSRGYFSVTTTRSAWSGWRRR
jgi:hypothetical protein